MARPRTYQSREEREEARRVTESSVDLSLLNHSTQGVGGIGGVALGLLILDALTRFGGLLVDRIDLLLTRYYEFTLSASADRRASDTKEREQPDSHYPH